jgi:hypothetical protein
VAWQQIDRLADMRRQYPPPSAISEAVLYRLVCSICLPPQKEKLSLFDLTIADYSKAIAIKPGLAEVMVNIGGVASDYIPIVNS